MKTRLRLNSVVPFGVGSGPESVALDLIYSFLLTKFGQNEYSYISINQIDEQLKEFISKEGKNIHINIDYPTSEDFNRKRASEKNVIRLNVIHESLIRIARKYKKLNEDSLVTIKNEILKNNFSFDIVYRIFKHKKKDLLAYVIVHPEIDRFKFFVKVKEASLERCNLLIYEGVPGIIFDSFFSVGKWKREKEIIITGKERQVDILIDVEKCKVEYVNLTKYRKAPLFEMMKADVSKEDKEQAYKDWLHSLPPDIAYSIRKDKDN